MVKNIVSRSGKLSGVSLANRQQSKLRRRNVNRRYFKKALGTTRLIAVLPTASSLFSYILVMLGLFLLTLWGLHTYLRTQSLTLNEAVLAAFETSKPHTATPVRIFIPSISTIDIVKAGKIQGEWTISKKAANYVLQSATPGTPGNAIIYGHNTYNIFANLHQTKKGDQVTLYMSDGVIRRYTVVDIQEVTPDNIDVLKPTITEVLTIYTCSGWLDSKRFVVRAVPSL